MASNWLVLGLQRTPKASLWSQERGQKKDKIQDKVYWSWYTGCQDIDFFQLISLNSVFLSYYKEGVKENIKKKC